MEVEPNLPLTCAPPPPKVLFKAPTAVAISQFAFPFLISLIIAPKISGDLYQLDIAM